MKPLLLIAIAALAVIGCGGRIARLDRMSRVESAVLTDANTLAPDTSSTAQPAVHVTDPDRLAALETFLIKRRGAWKKVSGRPRPARFQLELLGEGEPIYTVWIDPGYLALAEGKEVQETRLSNADMAELLSCLGLPADYLSPAASMAGPGPSVVPADWATPLEGTPHSTPGPPHQNP
ncbi:MAG: hypothetical protein WBC44_17095 [Planctomycetaceae bacterium]